MAESVTPGKVPPYKLALQQNGGPSIGLKYLKDVTKLN
jgi:hypothetical protein